jgi:hypothetical protein
LQDAVDEELLSRNARGHEEPQHLHRCISPARATAKKSALSLNSEGPPSSADRPAGTRLLADLRHQLCGPPTPIRTPDIDAAISDDDSVGIVA